MIFLSVSSTQDPVNHTACLEKKIHVTSRYSVLLSSFSFCFKLSTYTGIDIYCHERETETKGEKTHRFDFHSFIYHHCENQLIAFVDCHSLSLSIYIYIFNS